MPDPVPPPTPPLLRAEFEGHPLTILSINGRTAWVAREVGHALGYAQRGSRLAACIGERWDEFLPGVDYAVLTGEPLAQLKAAGVDIDAKTPSLVVLFESGVLMVLTKTHKDAGRRLRRYLVDEVLPRLARGESVPPPGRPAAPARVLTIEQRHWLRELRLARRVDLDDRKFRSAALLRCVRFLYEIGQLTTLELATWEVRAAEIALGEPLPDLETPPVPPTPANRAAAAVDAAGLARDLGVSVERLRRAASQLGLPFGASLDEAAAKAIADLLRQQGFVRPEAA